MNLQHAPNIDVEKVATLADQSVEDTYEQRKARMDTITLEDEVKALFQNKNILDVFVRLRDK